MHARVYDHAGPSCACDGALVRIAFRILEYVGIREINHFVAPWLACMLPYRRFADTLADGHARLGADVVRYTFIAVDFHHLRFAGLPAHPIGVLDPAPHHVFVRQGKGVLQVQQASN
jgi:hypothetical protein